MIVADRKPVEEIIEYLKDRKKILILGCNECVTVCEAGGKKEVQVLASALRMNAKKEGNEVTIDEITLERQCDRGAPHEGAVILADQLHRGGFLSPRSSHQCRTKEKGGVASHAAPSVCPCGGRLRSSP